MLIPKGDTKMPGIDTALTFFIVSFEITITIGLLASAVYWIQGLRSAWLNYKAPH